MPTSATRPVVAHREPFSVPAVIKPEPIQAEKAAPIATPLPTPVPTPASAPAASVQVSQPSGSEADAKAFIYDKESGNRPTARNAGGCYGLGQDCNGIVESRCGADYACQDAYFTEYMQARYHTWSAAKAHWLARVPINGRDVGNWW